MLYVLVSSVPVAAIYVLVALGFVVIFRSTGVLNLAQGALALLTAYLTYSFVHEFGNFYEAAITALAISFVVGGVLYLGVFNVISARDEFLTAILSFFVAEAVIDTYSLEWGTGSYQLKLPFDNTNINLHGPGLATDKLDVFTTAVSLVGILAVCLVTTYTAWGLRSRATASSRALTGYYHINVRRVAVTAWGLGSLVSGIAGILFAMRAGIDPSSNDLGLVVIPAIILGGFDSLKGSIVGGVVLAVLGNVVATYVGGRWSNPVGYGLLLLLLLFRPTGLFGTRRTVRV